MDSHHRRPSDAWRSPLAPLGGNAELSRIELLPLASLGENKEFEPIPLRGTAQLRIGPHSIMSVNTFARIGKRKEIDANAKKCPEC